MEPASTIIERLGGNAKVARILGVHRSRPWKWTRPREEGGANGLIPLPHIPKLIAAGRSAGVHLTGDDFLPAVESQAEAE